MMPCGFLCPFLSRRISVFLRSFCVPNPQEPCLFLRFFLRHIGYKWFLKEVWIIMTLNIIFFTITIKRRDITIEEALHNQKIEKMYDEIKDRQISMYRPY